jgi:hypothetical protein
MILDKNTRYNDFLYNLSKELALITHGVIKDHKKLNASRDQLHGIFEQKVSLRAKAHAALNLNPFGQKFMATLGDALYELSKIC